MRYVVTERKWVAAQARQLSRRGPRKDIQGMVWTNQQTPRSLIAL